MDEPFHVCRLSAKDAPAYRALRLTALQLHPEGFGSSFGEEESLPEAAFAERLTNGIVFGALQGEVLIGCAGLARREKAKLRHKAVLWGMFVLPGARRSGVAKQLLERVLAYARTCCDEVVLTVVEGNDAASRLYTNAGFESYGREPDAIKIGDDHYHEVLMRLPLRTGES